MYGLGPFNFKLGQLAFRLMQRRNLDLTNRKQFNLQHSSPTLYAYIQWDRMDPSNSTKTFNGTSANEDIYRSYSHHHHKSSYVLLLEDLEQQQLLQRDAISMIAFIAHIATKICCLITITTLLICIWAFSAYRSVFCFSRISDRTLVINPTLLPVLIKNIIM